MSELNRAATGTDLLDVAAAYEQLAEASAGLADVVEAEDRASGVLPPSPRPRSA